MRRIPLFGAHGLRQGDLPANSGQGRHTSRRGKARRSRISLPAVRQKAQVRHSNVMSDHAIGLMRDVPSTGSTVMPAVIRQRFWETRCKNLAAQGLPRRQRNGGGTELSNLGGLTGNDGPRSVDSQPVIPAGLVRRGCQNATSSRPAPPKCQHNRAEAAYFLRLPPHRRVFVQRGPADRHEL
jgi:hypothetical protein